MSGVNYRRAFVGYTGYSWRRKFSEKAFEVALFLNLDLPDSSGEIDSFARSAISLRAVPGNRGGVLTVAQSLIVFARQ